MELALRKLNVLQGLHYQTGDLLKRQPKGTNHESLLQIVICFLFDPSGCHIDHPGGVGRKRQSSQRFFTLPSGYSVDNLDPCPPVALLGEQSYMPEGLTLSWNRNTEADLDCYNVYRGLTEEFEPELGNLLSSPCDTTVFDGDWTWETTYWYKVSAVDIHGNESGFALLSPEQITGDDPPATPLATFLEQNYPNPFNPATRIAFGLEAPGHVSLRIYDTAGRLVRVLVEAERPSGTYEMMWNGKDERGINVATGVYFYRLAAGSFLETRKMVLLR